MEKYPSQIIFYLFIASVEKKKLESKLSFPSLCFLSAFLLPCVEPVAGVVQGRSGANIGDSPVHSASGQVSDRAMQRQPTGRSAGGGRRLQAGRQSTRTVSLQGTGAGRQHNTVSTLRLIKETRTNCSTYQLIASC